MMMMMMITMTVDPVAVCLKTADYYILKLPREDRRSLLTTDRRTDHHILASRKLKTLL